MRKRYDEQLERLHDEIIRMGEMIERAILDAVSALETHDVCRAKEIIASDEEIDQQEKLVEGLCMKLLLSQQPVAGDLRRVSSALKVITDMERIGDHATDISELTLMLGGEPGMGALDPISTSRIEDLALELKRDYTIVMVTHNMQQAARVSDKTVFFLLGEIIESGETERIFSRPQDKRTEDYITGRFG